MTTHRKFWENMPRMDFAEFVRDFLNTGDWAAADWTSTKTGAATEVISVGAGASGVLVCTNTNANADVAFHQNKIEAFRFQVGKALEYETRIKLSDALNINFVTGLQITDTTPLAVSDGVFIRKNAADLYPDLVVCKDGAETVVQLPDPMASNVWVKLGFYYDGTDTVQAFVNDVRVASAKTTNLPTTAPVLDDAELLAISFGLSNGSAAAHVLSVDYIRAVQQR